MDNSRKNLALRSCGELPIPAAIYRFHARKIDEVTKVAHRKSQIRVAEEGRIGGGVSWKRVTKRERERNDDGGGGYLINN